MARLKSLGFELNTLASGVEIDSSNGNIDNTHARSGTYCYKTSGLSSGASQFFKYQFSASNNNGPFYFRFYVRADTAPSVFDTLIALTTSSDSLVARLGLNTNGTFGAVGPSGGMGNSPAITINDGNYHRLEIKWDSTGGSSHGILEFRLDGNVFATSSVLTLSAGGIAKIQVGGNINIEANTAGLWYFDDIAINDSNGANQNSYPGDGQLVYLKPNAAGDNNAFTLTNGGTVGAANNYTRVNEIQPDDGTTYNGDITSGDIDDFNIDNTPGSIGASDNINVVQLGIRYAAAIASLEATFVGRIKKASGGTVSESSAITPSSTSYTSNANSTPLNPPLTLYNDPDGSAWTKATLDTAQIGYRISTTGTNAVRVTNVWLIVESHPPTAFTSNVTDSMSPSDSIIKTDNKILVDSISFIESILKVSAKALSDSISLVETLVRVTNKFLSDSISFVVTLLKALIRNFSDSISFVESFLKTLGKNFNDTVSLVETFLPKAINKFPTDSISPSETFSHLATLFRTLIDSISPTDSIIKALNKILIDINIVSDSGFAVQLDGVGNYITNSTLPSSIGSYTQLAFVKFNAIARGSSNSNRQAVMRLGTGDSDLIYQAQSNTTIHGTAYNGSDFSDIAIGNLSVGTVYVVANVVDVSGGNINHTLYLYDTTGTQLAVGNHISSLPLAAPGAGYNIGGPNYPLAAVVDNEKIYQRALSAAEIANFAQNIPISSANIAVNLGFNEGSGLTAFDSSGNNNNGTFIAGQPGEAPPAYVTGLTADNTLQKFLSRALSDSISFVDTLIRFTARFLSDSISFIESLIRFTSRFFLDYDSKIWPGLAINYNYNGAGSNPAADLQYLYDLGFRRVRLLVVTYNDNSQITAWHSILQTALAIPFTEISYGVSAGGNTITSSNINSINNIIKQELAYVQTLNDARITFCGGNEETNHVDGTTMTKTQMIAFLIAQSPVWKGIYTVGKLITVLADDGTVPQWYGNTGSFDKIGVNLYDTDGNLNSRSALYLSHFGSMLNITEWNSNNGYADFNNEANFTTDLLLRQSYLIANGFGTNNPCYLYNFMDSINNFGMKNKNTGVYRQAWGALLNYGNESLIRSLSRSLSDVLSSFVEVLIKTPGELLNDSISFTETFTKATVYFLADSISYIESLLRAGTRNLSDSIIPTENLTRFLTRSLTDSISFSESMRKLTGKFFSEIDVLTETFLSKFNGIIELTDVISLNESLSRFLTRSINDSISLIENFVKLTSKAFVESAVFLNENFFPRIITKTYLEVVPLTETFTKYIQRLFIDSITISNIFSKIWGRIFPHREPTTLRQRDNNDILD